MNAALIGYICMLFISNTLNYLFCLVYLFLYSCNKALIESLAALPLDVRM